MNQVMYTEAGMTEKLLEEDIGKAAEYALEKRISDYFDPILDRLREVVGPVAVNRAVPEGGNVRLDGYLFGMHQFEGDASDGPWLMVSVDGTDRHGAQWMRVSELADIASCRQLSVQPLELPQEDTSEMGPSR